MMRAVISVLAVTAALACGAGEPEVVRLEPQAEPVEEEVAEPALQGNRAPVIDSLELDSDRPRPGEQLVAHVSASDADDDPIDLEYRWTVGGKRMDESGPFLHVQGAGRDTVIEVTVTASDGKAKSRPENASARIANLPPRVLQVVIEPLGEVSADRDIVATPGGTDPDGDPIEYSYRWSVNGESISEDSSTLAASHYDRGDKIMLEVTASDGLEDSEPLASAPMQVVNAAPRITSSPGAIDPDGIFRYQVLAEDIDGDSAFRYRLLTSPEGMTIGFDDGELVWRPGTDAAGNHPVEIEVADLFGGKSTQLFELRLSYAAEDAPAAAADDASSDG